MTYKVTVADAAEDDVAEIVDYIIRRESALEPGLRVLEKLENAIASLSGAAPRGRIPPEFRRIGVTEFRELIVAPWRVVYSLRAKAVHVVAVLDLRRDAAEILRQRATRIADDRDER